MAKDDFLLTRSELAYVQRRRRLRRIIGIALLVLLGIGVIAGSRVRRAILGFQARRHARHAFVFIDQRKWKEARDEATEAYRLRPNEPDVIRAIARLFSRSGQGDALGYWKSLAAATHLTRDDLRDEIVSALKANDVDLADQAVQQLFKDQASVTPWDIVLKTDVLVRENHFESASGLARKVLANPAATRQDKLEAVVALDAIARSGGTVQAGDPKLIDERLAEIAKGDDKASLDALVMLAKRFLDLPANERISQPAMPIDGLIAKVNNHPLAKIAHKLLAADLEIFAHPDQRDQVVQGAIDRWKNGSNEELVQLAGWLGHQGEYQRELDAIPLERAAQTRELLVEQIDALSALNRWDDVRNIVVSEDMPLDPVIANVYLARCDAKEGMQKGADNDWQRAIVNAAGDLGKLLMLGDFAQKNGALQVAATAYNAAAVVSPKSLAAQRGRLRAVYATGDTKQVHAILIELLKIWPNDNNLLHDEAYVRILLLPPDTKPDSPELKAAEALASKLMVDAPDNVPNRTLLALVLLKRNRPYSAFALFRDFTPPANSLTPSSLAVHAAVVAAVGQTADARQELKRIPTDKLLPEERALIANL